MDRRSKGQSQLASVADQQRNSLGSECSTSDDTSKSLACGDLKSAGCRSPCSLFSSPNLEKMGDLAFDSRRRKSREHLTYESESLM